MSKERLKRIYNPCDECNYAFHKQNQESGTCKLCEFKSYINLEEQGLLLRLKCKKGQKVYYIDKYFIDGSPFVASMTYSYSCLDFPREYFATKEEAEEKLRELEGK